MQFTQESKIRVRKNFGSIDTKLEIPNLIEAQKSSYENFLQSDIPHEKRKNEGLHSVLLSSFPIESPAGNATLEFIKYEIEKPKYDLDECRQKGSTYSAGLKVVLRLIVKEIDPHTKIAEISNIKEQEVYLGEIPLMTKNATFMINGTERVVVSQMHRSPGVFFNHDRGKNHATGKILFSARIIPYRGSWIDFEFDAKDTVFFRIDRRRKLPITTLLYALGMEAENILEYYYNFASFTKQDENNWSTPFSPTLLSAQKFDYDIVNADTKNIIIAAEQKINPRILRKIGQEPEQNILLRSDYLVGKFIAKDIFDKHGSRLAHAGEEISTDLLELLDKHKIKEIQILAIKNNCGPYIRNTLMADRGHNKETALIDIFRVLRPGEPATAETSKNLLNRLIFSTDRYDLSEVGRVKINASLNLQTPIDERVLTADDLKETIKKLIEIKDGKGSIDDIDNLGNRRVRSVGELVENQFRIGVLRIQKNIFERMNAVDIDTIMPHDLINSKLLVAAIKEFFGSSQLSQFMDQTNPLSEITHKRRLSALGPGGVNRERAGLEVRDVHPTHYGRICPIETPEGQNIGLINSLTTYAKVNKYGFIETPYKKVVNGKATNEIHYLSALDEANYKIAQSTIKLAKDGTIEEDLLNCRLDGNFVLAPASDVDYMDINPIQVVSIGAAMIPFLENDDGNRALMGSNMQRQAVPLMKTEAPFVGTGVESIVAKDSGASIVALNSGVVEYVDSNRIVIKTFANKYDNSPKVDIYNLLKSQRSNHNTCITQNPIVSLGDLVNAGDVIADGPSSDHGEIALGKNVLVAYLPWKGYTFEDSIVISERVVKDDLYTSIHIEELELVARDTKLGPEEVTRDIPNVNEEHCVNLDEVGIVRIGAEIKPGDILVGKVTPKSESLVTPEERLVRCIYGEKASDVRDSSLYVPPGITGTVIEVRVLSRRGVPKDQRSLSIERQQIDKYTKDKDDELVVVDDLTYGKLFQLLDGQDIVSGPKTLGKDKVITRQLLSSFSKALWWQFVIANQEKMQEIIALKSEYDETKSEINKKLSVKIDKLKAGDDLPQGALKVVKVFIAIKHRLQPGDKMAGRHGNKGVVSTIVPVEDMPFLEDGTPIDMILNPLGLPSRMNIGQILETSLGWASVRLGKKINKLAEAMLSDESAMPSAKTFIKKVFNRGEISEKIENMSKDELVSFAKSQSKGVYFATPVFDGAKVEDVQHMLDLADESSSGQVKLIDGRTGEFLDRPVTIGYKYVLKLLHLVDDKVHARSIGPYSLVTQQPLGGKSHFGGQRFGEMECWAIQGYGASYILQEMLTIKSDDVAGRIKNYKSIVTGTQSFEAGIPESFNVIVSELKSLGLNISLSKDEEN
ncbi:MAG: DNA-directed RNA polymerase subunit beta [Rickettsiaceae bacterium]|nr:DNA-directed RNA polymerase subunit beta [Rickettsiaceae bacterium]